MVARYRLRHFNSVVEVAWVNPPMRLTTTHEDVHLAFPHPFPFQRPRAEEASASQASSQLTSHAAESYTSLPFPFPFFLFPSLVSVPTAQQLDTPDRHRRHGLAPVAPVKDMFVHPATLATAVVQTICFLVFVKFVIVISFCPFLIPFLVPCPLALARMQSLLAAQTIISLQQYSSTYSPDP